MERPPIAADQMVEQMKAPLALITQVATAFWVSQALYVAAKLGIADLLGDGPKSSEDLAILAGAHPAALRRVLRALVSVGIFAEAEDGRYRNNLAAQSLQTSAPDSLWPFVVMLGEPESWQAWGQMLHSVRTGQSAFEHVFGTPLFQYMTEHCEAAQVFDAAMTSRSMVENEAVLKAYDFSGTANVVDVGGGRGALLSRILSAYPQIHGVLFDLPNVIDGACKSLCNSKELARCRFEAGDFFHDAVPAGADVYLLKKVVHDWDDERARLILQSCRRAMSRDARLLLIEPVIPTGSDISFAKLLDLFMLVWPGGQERTVEEHQALLVSAGLNPTRIIATSSTVSIIEARLMQERL